MTSRGPHTVDAASADARVAAFEAFDREAPAHVAEFWGEGGAFCAGWDLKSVSHLDHADPSAGLDIPKDAGKAPRRPLAIAAGDVKAGNCGRWRALPWRAAWSSRSGATCA